MPHLLSCESVSRLNPEHVYNKSFTQSYRIIRRPRIEPLPNPALNPRFFPSPFIITSRIPLSIFPGLAFLSLNIPHKNLKENTSKRPDITSRSSLIFLNGVSYHRRAINVRHKFRTRQILISLPVPQRGSREIRDHPGAHRLLIPPVKEDKNICRLQIHVGAYQCIPSRRLDAGVEEGEGICEVGELFYEVRELEK